MNNKRIFVIGIALILMAIVVGTAVALSVGGVSYNREFVQGIDGVRFVNTNAYAVYVSWSYQGYDYGTELNGRGSGLRNDWWFNGYPVSNVRVTRR